MGDLFTMAYYGNGWKSSQAGGEEDSFIPRMKCARIYLFVVVFFDATLMNERSTAIFLDVRVRRCVEEDG